MTTSPINSTGTAASTPATASALSNPNSLANQNVFLKLLVAQLQNQDPSQPADGTQFVTQLAEFTNVSNTTDMAGDLDAMKTNLSTIATDFAANNNTSTSGTNSGTPSGTTGTNGTTNS
jgi:flagellar basal-body rod modification protein FlgD